jgi:RimJ/RimL family protein N-acetyltransferase
VFIVLSANTLRSGRTGAILATTTDGGQDGPLEYLPLLRSARLELRPLIAADADELASVLSDANLYTFTGGSPETVDRLRRLFDQWELRRSPDERERWLNWTARLRSTQQAIGYVQATVIERVATIAYVIGTKWQGVGLGREAVGLLLPALYQSSEVDRIQAWIARGHRASERVAEATGFVATPELDDDGERRWEHRTTVE